MTRDNWDCEKIDEDRWNRNMKWKCRNGDEVKTIKTKLKEEKTFPEEDYEYEGQVNGKEVTGVATTGHAPMKFIEGEDGSLSDVESAAGMSHINEFW